MVDKKLLGKDVEVAFTNGTKRCGKLEYLCGSGGYILRRYMGRDIIFTENQVEGIREVDPKDVRRRIREAERLEGLFPEGVRVTDIAFYCAGLAEAVSYLAGALEKTDPARTAEEWEDEALFKGEEAAKKFLEGMNDRQI